MSTTNGTFQTSKLSLKDLIFIFVFLISFGGAVATYTTTNARMQAQLDAIELKASENKQELDDHNLDLIDYKLDQIDHKIDRIMRELGIE